MFSKRLFVWRKGKKKSRQTFINDATLRRVRITIVAVGKEFVLHNLSVCVFVALGIRYGMRMRHIVVCGLPRCAAVFFIINGTSHRR